MKKFLICLSTLFLMACSDEAFKGKEYVLTDNNTTLPITISFEENENRFNGKAVNSYFGVYKTDGDQMELSQIGATRMMGSPEEMAVEENYFQQLAQVRSYHTDDNQLVLILADGTKLNFIKQPMNTQNK